MQYLSKLRGVCFDERNAVLKIELDGKTRFLIELRCAENEVVEIKRRELCFGELGVFPEIIDHLLEGIYLRCNGFDCAGQHFGIIIVFELGFKPESQSFGGKLNRRERILDFMSQPAGDFAPGSGSLRLNNL